MSVRFISLRQEFFSKTRNLSLQKRQSRQNTKIFSTQQTKTTKNGNGVASQWRQNKIFQFHSTSTIQMMNHANIQKRYFTQTEEEQLAAWRKNLNEKIEQWKKTDPTYPYIGLLSDLASDGNMEEVEKVLREMDEKKIKKTPIIWSSYFHTMAVTETPEAVIEAKWKQMVAEGVAPHFSTYMAVIAAFCRNGAMKQASEFFEEMKKTNKHKPNDRTYNLMISGWADVDLDKAEKMFEEMKENEMIPGTLAYNSIIRGYLMKDDLIKALDYFRKMSDAQLTPNESSFNLLLFGLLKSQKVDQAEMLFRGMVDADVQPTVKTFNILLQGLINNKKEDKVKEYLDHMVRLGVKNDDLTNTLVEKANKALQVKEALKNSNVDQLIEDRLKKGFKKINNNFFHFVLFFFFNKY